MNEPFTCKEVRQKFKAIIEEVTGSEKVYSYNCLNFKTDPKTGKPDLSGWVALVTYGDDAEFVLPLAPVEHMGVVLRLPPIDQGSRTRPFPWTPAFRHASAFCKPAAGG